MPQGAAMGGAFAEVLRPSFRELDTTSLALLDTIRTFSVRSQVWTQTQGR